MPLLTPHCALPHSTQHLWINPSARLRLRSLWAAGSHTPAPVLGQPPPNQGFAPPHGRAQSSMGFMSRSRDYFLTGPRLGFSRWTPEDLPLAVALWGDPEVARLIGGPFSPEQIQEKLRQEIAWQASHKIQYWPIFLLATDEHVGCAGLRPYQAAGPVHELGFHLRPAFWGKGLAEEAARAVIAHAFQTLHVAGLFAGHHPENAASQRILLKLGFRYTHDDLYPPTGLLHPCYSLAAPNSPIS